MNRTDQDASPSAAPPDRFDRILGASFGLLALLLCTLNLGNHYLWQDEAQTALVARTVLERGLPYGTDGVNYFSQEGGIEYGPGGLWKWHTWLSFYLVAASFATLGVSTFAARLPFALLGAATVWLAFRFLRGRAGRAVASCGTVLLLTCVPFLLLARQSRYYAAAAFFSLLALDAFLDLLAGRRRAGLRFLLSSTALFHSHFVYFFALIPAAAAHALFRDERLSRNAALRWLAIAAAFNLPWMLWLGSPHGTRYEEVIGWRAGALKLVDFVRSFDHVFSGWALAGLVVLIVVDRLRARRASGAPPSAVLGGGPGRLLALFVAANLVLLSVSSPAAFFRYLAPLIAPVLALVGLVLGGLSPTGRRLGGIVLAIAIVGQPLLELGYELTHDYDGPIEGIVEFLRERADPGDVVAITYGDLPLKFYLPALRVVGGLTGEDPAPALAARWVILRRNTITDADREVREYLESHLPLETFRRHELPYADLAFENRESPDEHRYRTVHRRVGVVVLERAEAN